MEEPGECSSRESLHINRTVMRSKPIRDGVTVRAIFIGLAFIPINVYLVVQWETVWGTQYPTTMSIFFNAVFCVLLLVFLNMLVRKLTHRELLTQRELLTIYVILTIAVTVSGHDYSQGLFCTLGTSKWFATPENEWSSIFWKYVPSWLSVNDDKILHGFYTGQSTFYTRQHILGWIKPMFWWILFLMVLVYVTLCINCIIRRQWIENEKLTYPLTQIPYEITRIDAPKLFFKNGLLWIGISIALLIGIVNGFNLLFGVFPRIPLSFDLGPYFTERPWNAISGFPLYINPYAIGLAYPIPLDLLFSCWFFFILWKAERIFGSAFGVNIPGYPFEDQQILGSYLGIALVALWMFRKPMFGVLKDAIRNVADPKGPMTYRSALIGIMVGFAFIIVFFYEAGTSVFFAFSFFAIYFVISFAYTRMRAELGPPLQGIHYSGPLQLIVAIAGSRKISAQTLTVSAPLWTMTKEFRNIPMPFQLESFKLSDRAGIDNRKLWKVMILSAFLGLVVTAWAFLQFSYKLGGIAAWRGVAAYSTVERWIVSPTETDKTFLIATTVGLMFVIFNTALRLKFIWWNIHPLGYPLAGYYHFDKLWFPFLMTWLIKRTLLKYGGIRSYRRALPIFVGFVLGDFIVGSIWGITGLLSGKATYAFKNW